MQDESTVATVARRHVARTCERCGREFRAKASAVVRGHSRFCTRKCWLEWRHTPTAVAARMKAKVVAQGDCWTLPVSADNVYAQFTVNRKNALAHRVAWELATGSAIPDGMVILHTCDNPACVRNDDEGVYEVNGRALPRRGHLALGTHADNSADMVAKGRAPEGERSGAYTRPGSVIRGSRHYETHLSEADVRQIRRDYVPRKTPARILAQRYGVSREAISRIVNGDTWKHVA